MQAAETKNPRFPFTFWSANTIELFERAAYYSMASFMVIYLNENLGMSPKFATFLNGSLLWGLIFFLPILSGTLADTFGFKRSLSVAFILLTLGYLVMGNLDKFWSALVPINRSEKIDYTIPVVLAIVCIGIGGSIVKPCIAGTVQKTAGLRATLAFGIFYMVINIGSVMGRIVSWLVRIHYGIPSIFFPVATFFSLMGLIVVLFIYREPAYNLNGTNSSTASQRKSLGEALAGIVKVLRNIRFLFFIIVLSFFWILYIQLYNLIPLFLRFIDPKAPAELYALANPVMIVSFQLLITRLVKRWTPVQSIIWGISVTTLGMLLNIIPPLLLSDIRQKTDILFVAIPITGLILIASIASQAVGEMMASPRIYEYLGAIAPKGEEGLYLGYSNLPLAIGSIVGAPIGGLLFESFVKNPVDAGKSPDLIPMWLIVALMGIISLAGMLIYHRRFGIKKDQTAVG